MACLYVVRRVLEEAITEEEDEEHGAEEQDDYMGPLASGLGPHLARLVTPRLTALNQAVSECRRIATTPMPWVYILHLRFLMMIYLLFLPVAVLGWFLNDSGQVKGGYPLGKCFNEVELITEITSTSTCGATNRENCSIIGYCELRTKPGPGTWIEADSVVYIFVLTLLISTIIDYAILGLEEIGNEMQNPLGWNKSDLPLEEYCRLIQTHIKRMARVVYQQYGEEFNEELREITHTEKEKLKKQYQEKHAHSAQLRSGRNASMKSLSPDGERLVGTGDSLNPPPIPKRSATPGRGLGRRRKNKKHKDWDDD